MSSSPMSSASPSTSETGFQLLARLSSRPNLRNLWTESLFPGGLDPGECVEVSSDENGGGKTEFLLNLTAKCIQPEIWGNVDIEGLGVSVVYVDANSQFDLKRLTAILDLHLAKKSQRSRPSIDGHDKGNGGKKRVSTEHYVKSCLERLHLVQPSNSDQLILALERVKESFLMSNREVGLLILDSLNAFYWLERPVDDERNVKFYESPRHKKVCASLVGLVDTFKINVFVSLANIFRGGGGGGGGLAAATSTDPAESVDAVAAKDDFWTNHEWRKLRTYKLKLSKRIVYQDKNGGAPAGDARSGGGSTPTTASSRDAISDSCMTMERRVGQIPNQLVSFSLFKCSSKTVEKKGEFLIKSAGMTKLQ